MNKKTIEELFADLYKGLFKCAPEFKYFKNKLEAALWIQSVSNEQELTEQELKDLKLSAEKYNLVEEVINQIGFVHSREDGNIFKIIKPRHQQNYNRLSLDKKHRFNCFQALGRYDIAYTVYERFVVIVENENIAQSV